MYTHLTKFKTNQTHISSFMDAKVPHFLLVSETLKKIHTDFLLVLRCPVLWKKNMLLFYGKNINMRRCLKVENSPRKLNIITITNSSLIESCCFFTFCKCIIIFIKVINKLM